MTSIPINNAVSGISGQGNQSNTRDVSGKFDADFTKAFEKTSAEHKNVANQDVKESQKKADIVESMQNKRNTDITKSTSREMDKEKVQGSKSIKKEKIDELENDVLEEVAEELGITPKELTQIMEQMNLLPLDLLDQGNLSMVVANVNGESDLLSLVTNEELFSSVSTIMDELNQTVESFMSENQMNANEFESLLSQMETVSLDEQTSEVVLSNLADEKVNLEREFSVETKEAQNIFEQEIVTLEANQIVGEATTSDTSLVSKVEADSHEAKNEGGNQGDHGTQTVFQNILNRLDQTVLNENVNMGDGGFQSLADDVLEQMTNYIKLQGNVDVKEMEMQLTPANLGTIQLNVASKNGAVTAQITTSNEAVKQALEQQIVQVKERLENQGIKIEAVEVTIASHEFERNLEQNHSSKEQEVKKVSKKKIDLSLLTEDEILEEFDEGEQVEIDMMKKTGSTLNYMA